MKKKRILVIDDEKGFTDLVKTVLEETGRYDVASENRGKYALTAIRDFEPDLILLDLMIPEMDGATIANHIKQNQEMKHIPIVFLTATVTMEEIARQAGIIGGRVFIAKPVKIKELIECVGKQLIAAK